MKFPTRYLMAAALLSAPVSVAAQTAQPAPQHPSEHQRGQMRGQRGPGGGSPVQRLIARREQLGLSAEQVARLEAIDRDLQARNAPLHQQLAAIFPERAQRAEGARRERPEGARRQRGERPDSAARAQRRAERPQPSAEQRQQMEQRRAQAQPIMQQLRANGEQALAQARGVLTAEQQQRVREGRERRGGRGEPGQHRGRGGERRGPGSGQSR